MNCQYCGTPNDSLNQFCISCGQPLADPHKETQQGSLRRYLGIITARLVISLLGLWILNLVLGGLPFAKDLRIPDFDVPTTSLIGMIISIIVMVMLVRFVWALGVYWPQSFPKYQEAVEAFAAVAYLIILVALYKVGLPIFQTYATSTEPILVFQIILLVIALVIAIRASIIIYRALPGWLVGFRYLPGPASGLAGQPEQAKNQA